MLTANISQPRLNADIRSGVAGSISIGTTDYDALNNKPSINGVTVAGDKTGADYGLAGEGVELTLVELHGVFERIFNPLENNG